ncbi:unnamed protein product [Discosporangium mesarthrocarpum]
MVHGMRHCMSLKGIVKELHMPQDSPHCFCDNRTAIITATTPRFNGRTKHTDIKLKYAREYVTAKEFVVQYISTG